MGSGTEVEKYIINGGNRLEGEVEVSGAKNAAVAILPAVVLSDGICRIENIPNIADVASSLEILAIWAPGCAGSTRIQWRSTPAGYLPLWFLTIWPAK